MFDYILKEEEEEDEEEEEVEEEVEVEKIGGEGEEVGEG